MFLIIALVVVLSRALGVRHDETQLTVATRDVLAVAAAASVAAVLVTPRTWHIVVAAAIPVLSAVAIAVTADAVALAAVLSLDVTPLLFLAHWHAVGRRPART
ncbi:MAG: hypothetical protein JNL82_40275 [Myxococcales bacterium]|nr:hypothetical protein [Myxococcales bacterium]